MIPELFGAQKWDRTVSQRLASEKFTNRKRNDQEREKESATSPARSELTRVGTAVGSLDPHSQDPKEEVRQASQSGSLERRHSPFLVQPSLLALHFQVLSKNAGAGSEAGLPGSAAGRSASGEGRGEESARVCVRRKEGGAGGGPECAFQ